MRSALTALLLTLLLATPAAGQTGLLVVGGSTATAALAGLRWGHGPVEVTAPQPGEAPVTVLEAGALILTLRGARRIVVVDLTARESAQRKPTDVYPIPVTWARAPDPNPTSTLATRVARSAELALLRSDAAAPADPSTGPFFRLDAVNVTAARTPLETFGTAAPVQVLGPEALGAGLIEGELEALEDVPGVELDGVGAVRRQPVIRGFTGQRVLLLEDGLRLANSRRRLASVEPAALVGPGTVERIEVVRGPASVLYGSDAIGGVVNLVTRGAEITGPPGLAGRIQLVGSTAGEAGRGTVELRGRSGPVAFHLSGTARSAGAYEAPDGRFGDVELSEGGTVHDTGARDRQGRLELAVALPRGGRAFVRGEAYRAEESGFGYMDPALLGDDPTRVRLTFPDQRYRRLVAGWRSGELSLPVARTMEATVYVQDNRRRFVTDVLAPLGPGTPSGAQIQVVTGNQTDLRTVGGRLESTVVRGAHALTWGLDVYRDRSLGWDTTTTTLTGLGPPRTTVRSTSAVPDATLTATALFLQDRLRLGHTTEITAGVRYQDVRAAADDHDSGGADPAAGSANGPGRTTDRTLVASVGAVHRLTPAVALIASVARGFRSPNLVERFFSGPTPGGRGSWERNPDLGAETSLNVDVGARLRRPGVQAELFLYRTLLHDGIRLEATGEETEAGPVYRNVNIDRMVARGLEGWTTWSPVHHLALTASLEIHDRYDPRNPDDPVLDGVRVRAGSAMTWAALVDRMELTWRARWQAEQRENLEAGSVVGDEVPAFHVHDVLADVRLGSGHRLSFGVENLFDRLHARATNVGFFRPEPGRRFVVGLTARF